MTRHITFGYLISWWVSCNQRRATRECVYLCLYVLFFAARMLTLTWRSSHMNLT